MRRIVGARDGNLNARDSSALTTSSGCVLEAIDDARQTDPTIPTDLDTLARFNYTRPVNGDKADLLGFELNYQQQFVNLPAPWNGFGVFANYTTIDAESDITSGAIATVSAVSKARV